MSSSSFPHLHLIHRARGSAVLEGGGDVNPTEAQNQLDRQGHLDYLKKKASDFSTKAKELRLQRSNEDRPEIKGGVPFVLQIPEGDDGAMEFIAEELGLEIVAEYDDGYLIVATEDLDLNRLMEVANDFLLGVHGSGKMAKIIGLDDDPLSESRIHRLLDERLIEKWPFADADEYILDISIEAAAFGMPKKARSTYKTAPEVRVEREAQFTQAMLEYQQRWDEARIERETEIENFVAHYQGEICSITDDSNVVNFPDSFSTRIRMSGRGFKDLVKNYPSLFEVGLPDDIVQPHDFHKIAQEEEGAVDLKPPAQKDTSVCIIDSGIQEGHKWLAAAIDTTVSRCFIPGKETTDVADYVIDGGHGTRVAGAALYYLDPPHAGETITAPFWLLNARVLDENNRLLDRIFPPQLLREIIAYFLGVRGTRIYNHSISAGRCCRTTRMSVWATAIDNMSHSKDVLFIQAAGNISSSSAVPMNPGILNHIQGGRPYPTYLFESSSRIADPAQSLQALTVGSISGAFFNDGARHSVAKADTKPSSFTRTGFGLWDSIKPEVVEFGGDDVIDDAAIPVLTNPPEVCPRLIRSTLNGGPAHASDAVGTSFSAPRITHIAGQIQALFPDRETLLFRALIANSARWPKWAEDTSVKHRPAVARAIGYGVPTLERATENTDHRVTLVTESSYEILAEEGYIFGVSIPNELRRAGEDFLVRVDVTLSYSAEPRRTRKSRRGYLGVWLDWKSSKRNESFDVFRGRALKDAEDVEGGHDGNFGWTLGNNMKKDGLTDGVCRKNGTLQKDWMFCRSYELPDIFGIVVRGHKGWDRLNPSATAKFSLAVTFEAVEGNVKIYQQVKNEVEIDLRPRVEVEVGNIK